MLSGHCHSPKIKIGDGSSDKSSFCICFVLLIPKHSVFYLWVGRVVLAQSNQSYEGSADHFQAALGPHIPSFTPHIYPPPVLLLRELLNNRQHTSCTLALVAPRAAHLWARRPSFGRELKPAIYSGKLSGRSCIRVYPLCEAHSLFNFPC